MNIQKEMQVFTTAAKMLKSVAHPVRIEIINHLIKRKGLTVNDLKEKLRITQSMTSQHLAVLKNAGILDCKKALEESCGDLWTFVRRRCKESKCP